MMKTQSENPDDNIESGSVNLSGYHEIPALKVTGALALKHLFEIDRKRGLPLGAWLLMAAHELALLITNSSDVPQCIASERLQFEERRKPSPPRAQYQFHVAMTGLTYKVQPGGFIALPVCRFLGPAQLALVASGFAHLRIKTKANDKEVEIQPVVMIERDEQTVRMLIPHL